VTTDHYLVDAEVWKRLSGSKEAIQKFDMEKFNLKKPMEVMEQNLTNISNMFAVLEDSDVNVDINRACKIIVQEIKTSANESVAYYNLKQHKI
jgi:hypothetical protein